MSREIKICQNCKNNFVIEPEDFEFYAKINVPPPTFCPECRFQRRLMFMNPYTLYKRKCDNCQKDMIAMFPSNSPLKVFCMKCYWADTWDGSEYAMNYDPARNFFEQLIELRNKTPFAALESLYTSLVDTEYTNYSAYQKNCYMTIFADYGENSVYTNFFANIKDTADSYRIRQSELCYQCVGCYKCFNTRFSEECVECTDVSFSRNLSGCTNCVGCCNLRNASYCIFNQKYSKEEYFKKLEEFQLDTRKGIKDFMEKAKTFWLQFPKKFTEGNSLNVNVTGDYVYESKNAKDCYMGTSIEDSKFIEFITLPKVTDSYDYTGWGANANRMYESVIVGGDASDVKFSNECWYEPFDLEYCMYALSGSKHCFGCVNLKRGEYCILNKKYPKEEYLSLKEKIIEDMKKNLYKDTGGRIYSYGEFLPPEMSPFAYNETSAQDYFPLSEEEVKQKSFGWYQGIKNEYQITVKADSLPERISDTSENICKEVIECNNCKRAYRVVSQEFDLLKRFNLPIPGFCPNCRRLKRFQKTNLPKLFHRKCQCGGGKSDPSTSSGQVIQYQNTAEHFHKDGHCPNEFETSYSPDRPEIVYCEQCYQSEVV